VRRLASLEPVQRALAQSGHTLDLAISDDQKKPLQI